MICVVEEGSLIFALDLVFEEFSELLKYFQKIANFVAQPSEDRFDLNQPWTKHEIPPVAFFVDLPLLKLHLKTLFKVV